MLNQYRNEFHIQFTNNGSFPNTEGLAESITLPQGCNIVGNMTRILYAWRKPDGHEKDPDTFAATRSLLPRKTWVRFDSIGSALHGTFWEITKRLDDNTYHLLNLEPEKGNLGNVSRDNLTPLMGPICKSCLAVQMLPHHFERYKASLREWALGWLKDPEFPGLAVVDLEEFESYQSSVGTDDESRALLGVYHPTLTYAELFAKYIDATNLAIRVVCPRLYGMGWYGFGGAHPGHLVWDPQHKDDMIRCAQRDHLMIRSTGIPMPVYYFLDQMPKLSDRDMATRALNEVYNAAWSHSRLIGGFAYINCRTDKFPTRMYTVDEVTEVLQRCRAFGYQKFIVWDSVENVEHKNELQAWVDSVFVPATKRAGLFQSRTGATS